MCFAESEENMENRKDGLIFYCDDLSDMIDMLIAVEGIKTTYKRRHDKAWIRKVGDESLRMGLNQLSDIQITIIESLVFDDKNVLDLRNNLGMSVMEIRIEIRDMHRILTKNI